MIFYKLFIIYPLSPENNRKMTLKIIYFFTNEFLNMRKYHQCIEYVDSAMFKRDTFEGVD